MTMFKYLIPVAFLATLAVPAGATDGQTVYFKYQPDELTTAEKRHALLERIRQTSKLSCASAQDRASNRLTEYCTADLVDQFVRAIGDEELTVLATSTESKKYRTAQG